MITISSHPASKIIYDSLEALFYSRELFLSQHQHFSFICGAASDEPSHRSSFLSYLKQTQADHQILPILAEEAIEEFLSDQNPSNPDLGRFEKLIAECVDSVLIFPESAGSYAELGFFAASEKIKNKTLVANKNQTNSFINLGLIPLYNRGLSPYIPMLVIGDNQQQSNKDIVGRLQITKKARKYRTRLSFDEFIGLPEKHKMILIHELIRVLGYVTERNLFDCIHKVFKKYDVDNVKRLLAILIAMNYLRRNENGDYLIAKDAPALLEYEKDLFEKTKTEIYRFYQLHYEEALNSIEDIQ